MLTHWTRMTLALGAVAIGLGVAAPVAAHASAPAAAAAAAPAADPVPLTVTNNNFYDVHVYGWRTGEYYSLGVVRSFTTRKFELPDFLTAAGSDLRLIADPIGGFGLYASEPLMVSPGSALEMRVENNLNLSTVVIR